MLLLSSADFFQNKLFKKKIFQEHYKSVKWFGSRSGPTFYQSLSGSKLYAMDMCRRQKVAASKERAKQMKFHILPKKRIVCITPS